MRIFSGCGNDCLTSLLVGTGGPIVNEADLVAALQSGTIAGAGLDVFEQEPCPADAPIMHCPNVIAAPHALPRTDHSLSGMGGEVADIAVVRAPPNPLPKRLAEVRTKHLAKGVRV